MLPLILTHVNPSNNLILHKGGNNNLTFKPQLKKENVSRCPNKSSNMYFLSLVFLFKDANKKNLGCFSFYLRVQIVWIIGDMKQKYTCYVFRKLVIFCEFTLLILFYQYLSNSKISIIYEV